MKRPHEALGRGERARGATFECDTERSAGSQRANAHRAFRPMGTCTATSEDSSGRRIERDPGCLRWLTMPFETARLRAVASLELASTWVRNPREEALSGAG